jgi:hypothetical protein
VANLPGVIPRNLRPHAVKLHERFEPGAEFVLRLGWGYWWTHWHGRLVEVERHFAPDPSHTSMYMATSRAFREIAPALSQVSRTLAAIGKDH